MECIFCKIVAGEVPTELIAENDHAIAFLDLYPAGSGTHSGGSKNSQ